MAILKAFTVSALQQHSMPSQTENKTKPLILITT